MKFVIRHWFDVGGLVAVPLAIWALWGGWSSTLQVISLLNLAVLLVHQFEEYRLPGGEPWILNEVFMPKEGAPADRLPTNQLSRAWINLTAWPFYILPVIFPHVIWLGLAPIIFGMILQFIVHVIVTNRRLKSFYNPGCAAVVLGHVPLGIWYLAVVLQNGLAHWWDWVATVVYIGFFMGVVFRYIGFGIIGPMGVNDWPYDVNEYNRWDRERRLLKAGISPAKVPTSA